MQNKSLKSLEFYLTTWNKCTYYKKLYFKDYAISFSFLQKSLSLQLSEFTTLNGPSPSGSVGVLSVLRPSGSPTPCLCPLLFPILFRRRPLGLLPLDLFFLTGHSRAGEMIDELFFYLKFQMNIYIVKNTQVNVDIKQKSNTYLSLAQSLYWSLCSGSLHSGSAHEAGYLKIHWLEAAAWQRGWC